MSNKSKSISVGSRTLNSKISIPTRTLFQSLHSRPANLILELDQQIAQIQRLKQILAEQIGILKREELFLRKKKENQMTVGALYNSQANLLINRPIPLSNIIESEIQLQNVSSEIRDNQEEYSRNIRHLNKVTLQTSNDSLTVSSTHNSVIATTQIADESQNIRRAEEENQSLIQLRNLIKRKREELEQRSKRNATTESESQLSVQNKRLKQS